MSDHRRLGVTNLEELIAMSIRDGSLCLHNKERLVGVDSQDLYREIRDRIGTHNSVKRLIQNAGWRTVLQCSSNNGVVYGIYCTSGEADKADDEWDRRYSANEVAVEY